MLTSADRVAVTETTLARAEPIRVILARHPRARARVIASGGTVRALARLAMGLHRPRSGSGSVSSLQVNQVELPAGQLHHLADRLATLDLDARLALPGVQARRAPLLPIGAVVLSTLVETLGLQRLVVSEWGLREGAVIGALSLPADRRSVPD
jgi:exopolyphosphatase/pppGpp-phosphohydrolase